MNVFGEFFDTNKNGVIDRGDFELALQNVCMIRGWREDGPMHLDTKTKFFQIWDSLKVAGGVKYDTGEVSSDVWVQLWADPMKHDAWQQAYMNFMFNLFDTSGDGESSTCSSLHHCVHHTGLTCKRAEKLTCTCPITTMFV